MITGLVLESAPDYMYVTSAYRTLKDIEALFYRRFIDLLSHQSSKA